MHEMRAPSARHPDRHARLERGRVALRIKPKAQRVAVVVADRALRLPGCEYPERRELGNKSRRRCNRAWAPDGDSHPDHQAFQEVLAHVER